MGEGTAAEVVVRGAKLLGIVRGNAHPERLSEDDSWVAHISGADGGEDRASGRGGQVRLAFNWPGGE